MKTIAIVGVGALGTVAASLLKDVKLILIDRDIVEPDNLTRQALYTEEDIGKPKVVAAAEHLTNENIVTYADELNASTVHYLKPADIIIDGTDNFPTRFLINDYCKQKQKPWVFEAISESTGYVMAITDSPCLSCLYQHPRALDSCATAAVKKTAQITATYAVILAMRILQKLSVKSELVRITSKDSSFEHIDVPVRETCPACNGKLNYIYKDLPSRLCGDHLFQFRRTIEFDKIKQKFQNDKNFHDYGVAFSITDLTVFQNGRILVRALNEAEAIRVVNSKL